MDNFSLNLSLLSHQRQYEVASQDVKALWPSKAEESVKHEAPGYLFRAFINFPFNPLIGWVYASRHFSLAAGRPFCSSLSLAHRAIAIIECLPILNYIAAMVEYFVMRSYYSPLLSSSKEGLSPLNAALYNHIEVYLTKPDEASKAQAWIHMKELIHLGAQLNAKDNKGNTALHFVALTPKDASKEQKMAHLALFKLLGLKAGENFKAYLAVENKDGVTPLQQFLYFNDATLNPADAEDKLNYIAEKLALLKELNIGREQTGMLFEKPVSRLGPKLGETVIAYLNFLADRETEKRDDRVISFYKSFVDLGLDPNTQSINGHTFLSALCVHGTVPDIAVVQEKGAKIFAGTVSVFCRLIQNIDSTNISEIWSKLDYLLERLTEEANHAKETEIEREAYIQEVLRRVDVTGRGTLIELWLECVGIWALHDYKRGEKLIATLEKFGGFELSKVNHRRRFGILYSIARTLKENKVNEDLKAFLHSLFTRLIENCDFSSGKGFLHYLISTKDPELLDAVLSYIGTIRASDASKWRETFFLYQNSESTIGDIKDHTPLQTAIEKGAPEKFYVLLLGGLQGECEKGIIKEADVHKEHQARLKEALVLFFEADLDEIDFATNLKSFLTTLVRYKKKGLSEDDDSVVGEVQAICKRLHDKKEAIKASTLSNEEKRKWFNLLLEATAELYSMYSSSEKSGALLDDPITTSFKQSIQEITEALDSSTPVAVAS